MENRRLFLNICGFSPSGCKVVSLPACNAGCWGHEAHHLSSRWPAAARYVANEAEGDSVVAFYDIQMWRTEHNRWQSRVAITVSTLQELWSAVETETRIWDYDVILFCCQASMLLSSTVCLNSLLLSFLPPFVSFSPHSFFNIFLSLSLLLLYFSFLLPLFYSLFIPFIIYFLCLSYFFVPFSCPSFLCLTCPLSRATYSSYCHWCVRQARPACTMSQLRLHLWSSTRPYSVQQPSKLALR